MLLRNLERCEEKRGSQTWNKVWHRIELRHAVPPPHARTTRGSQAVLRAASPGLSLARALAIFPHDSSLRLCFVLSRVVALEEREWSDAATADLSLSLAENTQQSLAQCQTAWLPQVVRAGCGAGTACSPARAASLSLSHAHANLSLSLPLFSALFFSCCVY